MRITLFIVTLALCQLGIAAEPQWLYPWQKKLTAYLKTTRAEAVQADVKKVDPAGFAPGSEKRHNYLGAGYTPLLSFTAATVAMPAEDFLWSGIWRPNMELVQPFLQDKHHALKTGQIWIPAHPTSANYLAWAYTNDAKWNPYHGNKNLATRAAIISMTDLICWAENDYYYHDKRSSKPGRRWGVHSAVTGFSLTFNAFTYLKVKNVVPEDARKAWEEALFFMARKINASRPMGPGNMRLSVPVGMYYLYLGTKSKEALDMYERWLGLVVFGPELSPAGHFWDGGGRAPDGSYNGIGLHRLSELLSISGDKRLLQLFRHAYRLKGHLSLPMPNGQWFSPSHFNDRCQSSFANDQYQGREVQFVTHVPEAVPFLRRFRSKMKTKTLENLIKGSDTPSGRVLKAFPWGKGKGAAGRMHDWGLVLHLPDYMYHQDEAKVKEELAKNYTLPVLAATRFSRNFNNEFYCIRRPTYYTILYAGQMTTSDRGKTNSHGYLGGKGGYFNGFGGGGISAFWTPAGSFILGRMTAKEAYDGKEIERSGRKIYTPGWQDWANNHIIGQTTDDKIITSARTSWPKSQLSNGGNVLTISGQMLNNMKRQGKITDAVISYERNYTFQDDRVVSKLVVKTDKPQSFKAFYETIPLQITEDLKISFHGKDGVALADGETVKGVTKIQLTRTDGSVAIVFRTPQTIVQKGKKILSRQANRIWVRSFHVALPNDLKTECELTYAIVPSTEPGKGIQQTAGALAYPRLAPMDIPKTYFYAHYAADQGVKTDENAGVTLWKDLSGNGRDLKSTGKTRPALTRNGPPSITFNGTSALVAALPAARMKSLSVMVAIEAEWNNKTRIVSIPKVNGKDWGGDGFYLRPVKATGRLEILVDHRTSGFTPAAIGVGQCLSAESGELVLKGNGLKGKVMEVYIFSPSIPTVYRRILEKRLETKYAIKGQ